MSECYGISIQTTHLIFSNNLDSSEKKCPINKVKMNNWLLLIPLSVMFNLLISKTN